ncbi:hypothetical protein TIFTF001_005703 [Ficus carica]|uniref:Uncharacterized protein n=1 Tax=Ficus carica TaxID=3494 RepID=A0AA88A2B5_FICCA|nr:hypothetical protein TIFTF001_005703 [Ficus carica]
MKQLELEREKKIAEAAVKGKAWYSLGSKHDLKSELKLVSSELDGLTEKQLKIRTKIKRVKAIENGISSLKQKLMNVDRRKDYLHQSILKLRKISSDENACYYRYLSLLNTAEKLAEMKDVAAPEELSRTEVERFMSQWNTSKTFRDDHYEKRVLPSLDARKLSRDGRMRNCSEECL